MPKGFGRQFVREGLGQKRAVGRAALRAAEAGVASGGNSLSSCTPERLGRRIAQSFEGRDGFGSLLRFYLLHHPVD